MPKAVDHDHRRREIVEAYLRLVARDGLDGATTRAVADELGVASGALWHYFAGTDSLLAAAADEIVKNTNARIAAAVSGLRGLAALRTTMAQLLPGAKVTHDEAHVVVSFWGRAASRQALANTSSAWREGWEQITRRSLQEAITDGDLSPDTPVDGILRLLASVTAGQQVTEVLRGPDDDVIDHELLVEDCLLPWKVSRAS